VFIGFVKKKRNVQPQSQAHLGKTMTTILLIDATVDGVFLLVKPLTQATTSQCHALSIAKSIRNTLDGFAVVDQMTENKTPHVHAKDARSTHAGIFIFQFPLNISLTLCQ
jgi:hypothetical protein